LICTVTILILIVICRRISETDRILSLPKILNNFFESRILKSVPDDRLTFENLLYEAQEFNPIRFQDYGPTTSTAFQSGIEVENEEKPTGPILSLNHSWDMKRFIIVVEKLLFIAFCLIYAITVAVLLK
jgi:hypothetical protein